MAKKKYMVAKRRLVILIKATIRTYQESLDRIEESYTKMDSLSEIENTNHKNLKEDFGAIVEILKTFLESVEGL